MLAMAGMVSAVAATVPASADDIDRGPEGHALIMIDDPACVYCKRWHKDVGSAYRASDEGRLAPLNVIQRSSVAAKQVTNIRYTPTFVLVDREREVGRIVGYGGTELFWSQVTKLYADAGMKPRAPQQKPAGERQTQRGEEPSLADGAQAANRYN
jgi:hypothetical protein